MGLLTWLICVGVAATAAIVFSGLPGKSSWSRVSILLGVAATSFHLGYAGRGSTAWVTELIGWPLVILIGFGYAVGPAALRLQPVLAITALWLPFVAGWSLAGAPGNPLILYPPRRGGQPLPLWTVPIVHGIVLFLGVGALRISDKRDAASAVAVAGTTHMAMTWVLWAALPRG